MKKPRQRPSALRQHPLGLSLRSALAVALYGSFLTPVAHAQQPVILLGSLNGQNGFSIDGEGQYQFFGSSVSSAGDFNGDGMDDVIVGATAASNNGAYSGSSYVVFGRSGMAFPAAVVLSTLAGSNGFRLDGESNENSGSVAAAGDFNGDGLGDLVIGAPGADHNGVSSGSTYLVFGRSTAAFPTIFHLSALNGDNGFRLDGVAEGDGSGLDVSSAGDVNDDGFDDLIIGARTADPHGTDSGSSYVVFGRSAAMLPPVFNLSALVGSNGFRLDGVAASGFSGAAVSTAGDVNGDGIDDLIVGALGASSNGVDSGSCYVIFGRSTGTFPAEFNLSAVNGVNGFRLDGIAEGERSGVDVAAAGDINGDGIDDLIVGTQIATGAVSAGRSYVVFGRTDGFPASLNLVALNGSNGFRMQGTQWGDYSGAAVSAAGDVNGDGLDDLIVGAERTDSSGLASGSSYVVFGVSSTLFPATLYLSALNGDDGYRLDGVAEDDFSGGAVSSAGDVNGDGVGDLIIGARGADPNGMFSGSGYVVFGIRESIFSSGFE